MTPIGHASHCGVTVSDLDASLPFYNETLGMEVLTRFDIEEDSNGERVDAELVYLDAGGFVFQLEQFDRPESTKNVNEGTTLYDVGACHFAIEVDDLDAAKARLERDLDTLGPSFEASSGARGVHVHDPDGNIIEVMESPSV